MPSTEVTAGHAFVSPPSAVSLKHTLYAEILAVTSAMRKNSRWASSHYSLSARDSALASSLGLRRPNTLDLSTGQSGNSERDLMLNFQELKQEIDTVTDIRSVPLSSLLSPFFAIIRSPLSTGPITSVALSSLHSLFLSGLITLDSPSVGNALAELSATISHCKFEPSDSSGDEVVLFKIMTIIRDCMCSPIGKVLEDIEVCEMLETVLTTCCQMRLSEILRRAAESTMHDVVRTVFARLLDLDPTIEEAKLQDNLGEDDSELKMSVGVTAAAPAMSEGTPLESEATIEPGVDQISLPPSSGAPGRAEYGLPSIIELLRVIINILDPADQMHTDSTRLAALGILDTMFDVAGPRMGDFPSLIALVIDYGCKYLFQLVRSDNPAILNLSLRTISTMFETMRSHLKLQQELFLAFTIDRLAPPIPLSSVRKGVLTPTPGTPSSSSPLLTATDIGPESRKPVATPRPPVAPAPARGETREIMLEMLKQISRHPSFMVDLYVNYDCDPNCDNMFERLIEFLTQGVYPTPNGSGYVIQQVQASNYLCLDILLAFIDHTAKRMNSPGDWPSNLPPAQGLLDKKSIKNLVSAGITRFNANPKSGLAFLEENRVIYADPSVPRPRSLAEFLKTCTRVDKRILGDFISKPDNLDVLEAFIGLFDFKNKGVAEALRELLEAFRLPGESQQIARITNTFAKHFMTYEPAEVKNEDAVFVLAYSIIMLNTDLHNPQIRKKMTLEDYSRNVRGINDGESFSPEFVQTIYDQIRKREIVMPEEHTGQVGFEYAWKELLARSKQSGSYISCNTPIFDKKMFEVIWKPVISAVAYAFTSFEDDHIIERSIAGFRQCATLAGSFVLPDVFDYVVVSLSQATSLLSEQLPTRVPNYPTVTVEDQPVTVSTLSVKFGTNFRSQLAAVVLFNIVNGNGNALREGWTQIFEMFTNLFLHSLLPSSMLQMEDFLSGASVILLQGNAPSQPQPRGDGLLSALSSYLMTPYSTSEQVPEATDSDVESTLCTIDCITSCRLDELYSQIMHLDLEALVSAVRALEALAHERTVAKLRLEGDETTQSSQYNQSNRNSEGQYVLPYDPASVFLLETMVSVLRQTPRHIDELWPIVFEHISALLETATQHSVLLIERAIAGLFRLASLIIEKPPMRDQLYIALDLIGRFPPSIAFSAAEQIVAGVVPLIQKPDIVSSQTEWTIIFSIFRGTVAHQEAAKITFQIVAEYIQDGPKPQVTIDSFPGLVSILDEYANTANALINSQKRGPGGRRQQQPSSQQSPVIERGRKAVELLFELKQFIPTFVQNHNISKNQAWRQFCLPLMASLERQSTNSSREIRQVAITHLQRILLGQYILLEDADQARVEEAFNRVIFPLVDELLKPEVFNRDPAGMPETRLRAASLLCKAFMQLEVREGEGQADIRVVWIQVLDLLDRLMNINPQDQLREAIPETLKNVILVMNAAGLLVPPSELDLRTEKQQQLWATTEERLERFVPRFLGAVIGSASKPRASS